MKRSHLFGLMLATVGVGLPAPRRREEDSDGQPPRRRHPAARPGGVTADQPHRIT